MGCCSLANKHWARISGIQLATCKWRALWGLLVLIQQRARPISLMYPPIPAQASTQRASITLRWSNSSEGLSRVVRRICETTCNKSTSEALASLFSHSSRYHPIRRVPNTHRQTYQLAIPSSSIMSRTVISLSRRPERIFLDQVVLVHDKTCVR